MNGDCFDATNVTFQLNLLVDPGQFTNIEAKRLLKKNLEIILETCHDQHKREQLLNAEVSRPTSSRCFLKRSVRSVSAFTNSSSDSDKRHYVTRIVSVTQRYTVEDESVSQVSCVMFVDAVPIQRTVVESVLRYVDESNISSALGYSHYGGQVFDVRQKKAWHEGRNRWIIIGSACK